MGSDRTAIPRLFVVAGRRRSLLILVAVAIVSGAAMLPAMGTMDDHGASLFAFEGAASVERSAEILAGWGDAGKRAAWWQLVLDIPFLLAYGLFAAGACAAVAARAARLGRARLSRVATLAVWLGPLAAAADFAQNIALALVLRGHVVQPWPRISAVCGLATTILMTIALLFALLGWLMTRGAGETVVFTPGDGNG
jgi:hypothetical protein